MPVQDKWIAAAAQFFSGWDVEENLQICIKWMKKAKEGGASLVVLPENSNRDRDYFEDGKPSREKCWDSCETLDGAFVKGLQKAAKDLGIWCCVGVDLRGAAKPSVKISQLLIRPDGEIEAVHEKHVLWDYEYTLFEASHIPFVVRETELGRLGMLMCADGIVPDVPRGLALEGAQVFLNSLNSRGPDEKRVHIPSRAIENGVWHVSSNSVGNPHETGLLWPWTGGSQVLDPQGTCVSHANEFEDEIIFGEVRPKEADSKMCSWCDDLFAVRQPKLYENLTKPVKDVKVAEMYGPAPKILPWEGPESVKAVMMQLSFVHTAACTMWMTRRQVAYAKRQGGVVGVLPELWCFKRGEVEADPKAAAAYSKIVLEKMLAAAKEEEIHLCFSLVEEEAGALYHTAYLVGPEGVTGKYRKAHLNREEAKWATAGSSLSAIFSVPTLGRVAMMLGCEVWVPEVARSLAIDGVEIILHPADWHRQEDADMGATQRGGENRVHLVSTTRLDSVGHTGSQTTVAGEFTGVEPIPLMRYSKGVWARAGVEESILVELPRRQAHCKMMGFHLDVLEKRQPECYGSFTAEKLPYRS